MTASLPVRVSRALLMSLLVANVSYSAETIPATPLKPAETTPATPLEPAGTIPASTLRPTETWLLLASIKLPVSKDSVTLNIKEAEQRMPLKRLQFKVSDTAVRLIDAKIYFAGGQFMLLTIEKKLNPGQVSRAFTLNEKQSSVKKVVLNYKPPVNNKASVELLGSTKTL